MILIESLGQSLAITITLRDDETRGGGWIAAGGVVVVVAYVGVADGIAELPGLVGEKVLLNGQVVRCSFILIDPGIFTNGRRWANRRI